jgi:hypothetical protein
VALADFHRDKAHLLARLHALSSQPVADLYAAWPLGLVIAMKPQRIIPKTLLGRRVVRL